MTLQTLTANIDPDWAWASYEPTDRQPWDRRRAAHLFRRAGFGATTEELNAAVSTHPSDVVRDLLRQAQADVRQDLGSDPLATALLATGNVRSLASWWLHRMLNTPSQLLEKMTLFWHGHFATSADKVSDATLMFRQNLLLRRHALGSFGELTQGIARDPAMLLYLDSATSRKAHPNENFGRELMELFCLGEGNYTERDVQELARCFTGWEVRRDRFRFNRYQHDGGQKTILGQQGAFGGEAAVDIVLRQPACPRFIVSKLVRFFLSDEPPPADGLTAPLERLLRESDLQVAPVIERILSSNLFFSRHAMARRIRSPVELVIGLLRSLHASTDLNRVADGLHELGQSLFFPPNVKGWDGGRSWINTSTLLGRANLIGDLLHSEKTRFAGADLASLAARYERQQPDRLLDWLEYLLVAVPLSEETRQVLRQAAVETGPGESERIAEVIHTLSVLPIFQLC